LLGRLGLPLRQLDRAACPGSGRPHGHDPIGLGDLFQLASGRTGGIDVPGGQGDLDLRGQEAGAL
jgi:hypothetical protein